MIKLQNVHKSFTDNSQEHFHALADINLEIDSQECVVIKGESGSGKSTLLSLLGAIMKPTKGLIEVDGENIALYFDYHLSLYREEKVGFVTQSFHLFEELNVFENLLPSLLLKSLSTKEIQKRVDEALHICNILEKKKQKVSTLSGGEKQRCIIARAIVGNPKILLCDEPTANLDEKNSLIFINILKELHKSGKTIIIATHDKVFDNLDFIDRRVVLEKGKIESDNLLK